MSVVTPVVDSEFDAVVMSSPAPVVVAFTAAWCGPCQHLAPVVRELAAGFAGRVRFVSADVDACPLAAAGCRVSALPVLVLFDAGGEVGRFPGVGTS
jgi:thioredoxin-like negative regulator of GroEL